MSDIINLRRHRKQKLRADKERQAEENRLKFGQSRQERERRRAIRSLDERRLDGSKREGEEPGSGT